jgi:hypothetical protein
MSILEDKDILLVLSAGQHKLYVISTVQDNVILQISTTFENITDECFISNMFIVELT